MNESKHKKPSSLQRKSFLITCWQERESAGGKVKWRFRLESASFYENRIISNLEDLCEAIYMELQEGNQGTESSK
jgi:hypothetical protein